MRGISDRNLQSSLWARILLLHSLSHLLTYSEGQHTNLRLRGSKLQKGQKRLTRRKRRDNKKRQHFP